MRLDGGQNRHTVSRIWSRFLADRGHRWPAPGPGPPNPGGTCFAFRSTMTVPLTASRSPWTCPFCPLLCDGFDVETHADGSLGLQGSDCARARLALSRFATSAAATARCQGQPCDAGTAIAAAAALLKGSRQPLFGGLGTDVAGARALYALSCATGAICDAAAGGPLMQSTRALQDRGGFATSLAEVRSRADLVLCLGSPPASRYPEFNARTGLAVDDPRWLVLAEGLQAEDWFAPVAHLAALVEGRASASAPPPLRAAAERLQAARYVVVVVETAALGPQGALLIEMLQRVVATLNRSTRAAMLSLGGGDGASTVNGVFTWLSGLPLRTRLGWQGLEHEPVAFDATRLVAGGEVDLLLWLASFGTEPLPPQGPQPRVVIGHPALATEPADVFIPVATPGIGHGGHLFRTDGVVMMPLHGVAPGPLPRADEVLRHIHAALQDSAA